MNAAESSISCPKARLSLAVARAMPKQLHPGAQGNGGHPMLFRQAIVVISDVVAVAHGNRTHRGRLSAPATGFEGAAQIGPAPSVLRGPNRLLRPMCRSCAAA